MKTTQGRLCAFFPWLFKQLGSKNSRDSITMHTKATELSGFGELACFERRDLSYTSLRDVMAAQKRRPSLTLEVELSAWLNNNHSRSSKSRLLEKAALAWLQPSVADLSRQQSSFFSRFWLKLTTQTPMSTPSTFFPSHNSSRASGNCVVWFPAFKWFDLSPIFQHVWKPQPFPLLRQ